MPFQRDPLHDILQREVRLPPGVGEPRFAAQREDFVHHRLRVSHREEYATAGQRHGEREAWRPLSCLAWLRTAHHQALPRRPERAVFAASGSAHERFIRVTIRRSDSMMRRSPSTWRRSLPISHSFRVGAGVRGGATPGFRTQTSDQSIDVEPKHYLRCPRQTQVKSCRG